MVAVGSTYNFKFVKWNKAWTHLMLSWVGLYIKFSNLAVEIFTPESSHPHLPVGTWLYMAMS
jgi:hypothetical protein